MPKIMKNGIEYGGGGEEWTKIYTTPDISVSSTYNVTTVNNLSIDVSEYEEFEGYVYIRESANGSKIGVLKFGTKEYYNFNGSSTGYDGTMSSITRYIYGGAFISAAKVLTGYQLGAKWNGNVIATIEIYGKK